MESKLVEQIPKVESKPEPEVVKPKRRAKLLKPAKPVDVQVEKPVKPAKEKKVRVEKEDDVVCECGKLLRKTSVPKHLLSKFHLNHSPKKE
jgi:hypothetical protein